MPLLETKGVASAQGFGGAGAGSSGTVNYIEDVFSTYLYTGNSSTQTITNGIDLAGKGGLVWTKARSSTRNHSLRDTVRGRTNGLSSNLTDANLTWVGLDSFNSNGYTLGDDGFPGTNSQSGTLNYTGTTYVSWTFREQPKFFDVVTYTGDGSSNRQIAHNLGSAPGCVIVKRTDASGSWVTYHRGLTSADYAVFLNFTNAQTLETTYWNSTAPTSTNFTVGSSGSTNQSGGSFVAYLFAHNAGGFGLAGTDNVISCGSFNTDGSGNATVNLGYEPQWLMYKRTDGAQNWFIVDVMRGFSQTAINRLVPNDTTAESTSTGNFVYPTATGFEGTNSIFSASANYIYIAIRRGPMKTPTSGTSVFSPVKQAGGGTVTTNFPVDLGINTKPSATFNKSVVDRLRGVSTTSYPYLLTETTAAEVAGSGYGFGFDNNTGYKDNGVYGSGETPIYWNFRRAPSFFDEVCYTGDNQNPTRSIPHNLAAVPELIIHKYRNVSGVNWNVYLESLGTNAGLILNGTNATITPRNLFGTPSASNFVVKQTSGDTSGMNWTGTTYVAYLFATCPGVSKVGSYTGTGALQTVNCGFTGGARFVLIKRTDSTGDWYVYDSARGISASNDPYLFLNSSAAEVTGTNYVDTTSVGFQVTAAAPAGLNANGGTYIFLAIA